MYVELYNATTCTMRRDVSSGRSTHNTTMQMLGHGQCLQNIFVDSFQNFLEFIVGYIKNAASLYLLGSVVTNRIAR